MAPAAFQFIASAITDVDCNSGRATDVVVTAVTAVAAVGAPYARRQTISKLPYPVSHQTT
jgi:hypothetical protein